MEDFKISQLTKELVAVRLKNMGDPCAAAAELVKKTLAVALKGIAPGNPGAGRIVRDACQGGMTGLLIAEQSVSKGAVKMLEAAAELAAELGLDPTSAMRSALEGIADLHRLLTPEQVDDIRREIEAHFMGAGSVFYDIVRAMPRTQASRPGT